ncbi:MAG: hypothetical protein AAFV80_14335, partial [Bacteroidota bacterium]
MKYLNLAFFLAIAFLFSACDSEPDYLNGFSTSENDLQFKFLVDEAGERPQPGDQVDYHVYFLVGDSVYNSSRMMNSRYVKGRVPQNMDADFGGNQLLQGLAMMSPGDSLVFFKPADSVNLQLMPELFKSGAPVFVHLALDKVKPFAELEAE